MKIRLSLILFLLGTISLNAQYWNIYDESDIRLEENQERQIVPSQYEVFELDILALKTAMKAAPEELANNRKDKEIVIGLPMPDGRIVDFRFYHSEVMMEGLAAKYPNLRSYKGYSIDRSMNARFDFGPYGFHGSIHTPKGKIYIDPYADNLEGIYQTYFTKFHQPEEAKNFRCGLNDVVQNDDEIENLVGEQYVDFRTPDEFLPLRTYRFALACTGGWGQFQGTVENALSKMVTGVNRLNLIFENELAVRILLINNNDELIHLNPATDPYATNQANTPNNGTGALPSNTSIVNNIVGVNSYDVGHVWSNCSDTGGVAYLGSMCNLANKAGGVTCIGGNSNVNNVMVNITAHELGHQMDANHSFNHCDMENENNPTGYEPGSGVTIMSYGGGPCGSQNYINGNYDFYNIGALVEMFQHTRVSIADGCSSKLETNNTSPTAHIDLEDDFYIPLNTPFEMTGIGEDIDGDLLTYSWEQYDFGPLTDVGNPVGNGPSFRVFPPKDTPSRVFPELGKIVNNISDVSEVLPTYGRDFTFRFVVRDNNPEAGGVAWDQVEFKAAENTGPFSVMYPNLIESFDVGEKVEVTWDVAFTDIAPINCDKVDIFLSTDGGFTYPIILAQSVDNNGSAEVIMPLQLGITNRIKIKASENIFFDISDLNFEIKEPATAGFYFESSPYVQDVCLPAPASFDLQTAGFAGFAETIHFEVTGGLPEGAIATFSQNDVAPDQLVNLEFDLSAVDGTGIYPIEITATADGVPDLVRTIELRLTGTNFSALETVYPANGQSGIESLPTFSWLTIPDATSYTLEVADSPAFGSSSFIFETNLVDTFFTSNIILDKSTLFYWRVKAGNDCAESDFTPIRTFGSEALNCSFIEDVNLPINISQSGTQTVEGNIVITASGQVQDINIKKIKGLHSRISDLRARLESPEGKSAKLWSNKCNNLTNFNLGFDDDSALDITCPLTTGSIYLPEEPLSVFNGDEISGIWKLIIEDTQPGAGGEFQSVEIEFCSNATLENPVLVNNEFLGVPPGQGNIIQTDKLLVEDANNTSEELIYTLVQEPLNGTCFLNNVALVLGDQFSQAEIDQNRIKYKHDGSATTDDYFWFTVIDGEGGWIDITQYDIQVDPSFSTSVESIDQENFIQVFPNPTQDQFTIDLQMDFNSFDYQLINVAGQILQQMRNIQTRNTKVIVNEIPSGVYILKLNIDGNEFQKRMIISN